jgi:hypothetical protein
VSFEAITNQGIAAPSHYCTEAPKYYDLSLVKLCRETRGDRAI